MPPISPEMLLAGPRGRRLLLEFARSSEQQLRDPEDRALGVAEFWASYRMAPKASRGSLFGDSTEPTPTVLPADVAHVLSETPLLEPTEENLRPALADAAAHARYWQEPEGTDVLAATVELNEPLHRIAEHLAAGPAVRQWLEPVQLDDQHVVHWDGEESPTVRPDVPQMLEGARQQTLEDEVRWNSRRYTSITSNFSADWWSFPHVSGHALLTSTGTFSDGSPSGLWWVEDAFDWDTASTYRLEFPDGAEELRLLEISGPQVWAELCVRYPLEVTYQKRHDWYRATGRDGRWVIPDWRQVARDYDGVHLTTACYLQAAGEPIAVPWASASMEPRGAKTATAEFASIIAGWNPDQTYWFSAQPTISGNALRWWMDDHAAWHREESR